ncbi:PAS domain S-box protein [Thermodesulfobacteriota bacterium]
MQDADKTRKKLVAELEGLRQRVRDLERERMGGDGRSKAVLQTDRDNSESLAVVQRDLITALNAVTDLDEALELCLDAALRISGMEAGGVYLLNDDSTLTLAVHKGISDEFVRKVSWFSGKSEQSRLIRASNPLYCCADDPEISLEMKQAYLSEGLRATAAIPILHDNGTIASINLGSMSIDKITHGVRYGLEAIAGQMGTHIARMKAEEALRQSESRYRALFHQCPDPIALVKPDGTLMDVNESLCRHSGYSRDEALAMNVTQWWADAQDRLQWQEEMALKGSVRDYSAKFRNKDGEIGDCLITSTIMRTEDESEYYLSVVRDVTERNRAERALQESETKYRQLVELSPDPVVVVQDGVFSIVNRAFRGLFGYSAQDVDNGLSFSELVQEHDKEAIRRRVEDRIAGKPLSRTYLIDLLARDGSLIPCETSGTRIQHHGRPADLVIIRDITERKSAEERLRESVKEKEVLLREIHHRVKNNLAVISSLLRLHSRNAKDRFHREMFLDAQDRILSMALAHEKLCEAKNLSRINMKDYVASLVDHLNIKVGGISKRIDLKKDVDALHLDLNKAVPLGFLINELVSNSLKHAFPDRERGSVTIALGRSGQDELQLTVLDDGIGIPETVELGASRFSGLSLVTLFTKQLDGRLELVRHGGTEFRIRFSVDS